MAKKYCDLHVLSFYPTGDTAGVSRVLCKFPVCTNPACQFRHEDADGNFIPPPAQTRATAAAATSSLPASSSAMDLDDHDDLDVRMDTESSTSGLASSAKTPMTAEQREAMLNSPLTESIQNAGGVGKGGKAKAQSIPGKPLNGTIPVACKFGTACTNKLCKFVHDARKPCHFGVKCFKGESTIKTDVELFSDSITHQFYDR